MFGEFHGEGKLEGEFSYVGSFSEGKFHGRGKMIDKNIGIQYEGTYKNNMKEGEFIFINDKG